MPASPDQPGATTPAAAALQREVVLAEPLHARPAGQLVRAVAAHDATVTVHAGARSADARSVLALMSLGADAGAALVVTAEGPGAEPALAAALAVLQAD